MRRCPPVISGLDPSEALQPSKESLDVGSNPSVRFIIKDTRSAWSPFFFLARSLMWAAMDLLPRYIIITPRCMYFGLATAKEKSISPI